MTPRVFYDPPRRRRRHLGHVSFDVMSGAGRWRWYLGVVDMLLDDVFVGWEVEI